MTYDELLIEASSINVDVKEKTFHSKAKGLCFNNRIAINDKIETSNEKNCVLAEELGHYHTSFGDIIDLDDTINKKQEIVARRWAHNKLVSFENLIKAHKLNIKDKFELCEFLNITTDFLDEAIEHYKQKYGAYHIVDNYIIFFDPLGILFFAF